MSSAPLEVLDANDAAQAARWLALWETWPAREVYAHPAYVRLYADDKSRPCCACYDAPEGKVLYPFLLRDLTGEDFWTPDCGPMADLTSPYGYSGPFAWDMADRAALSASFWEQFDAWTAASGAVCEFVRFSLFGEGLLDYPGEREERLQNVVRSLDLDPDAMFRDFEHKVRKNVKKAQRSGVTVEADPTGERLEDFLRIYYDTMERRQAGAMYYFPREYFAQLQAELPGQWCYFHAVHEGAVVSTELVLLSAENVYSFLGGTQADRFDLRPNDLLKWEIIRWAQERGKQRFVLGAGTSLTDGIYRYKLSLAPRGTVPFFIGRRILLPDAYDRLVANKRACARAEGRDWEPRPGFFPAYRA